MSDEKQEGQKTVVSFIVGLLIGGLLVWAFSGPAASAPNKMDDNKDAEMSDDSKEGDSETEGDMKVEVNGEEVVTTPAPTLPVGEGKVAIENQPAGTKVSLASATYPVSEGWIGVRDYQDGQLGGLLGVVRFSEEQGLVPDGIQLQRATQAGKEYAVVVYTESGDREFSLADDKQLDSVFATFKAE